MDRKLIIFLSNTTNILDDKKGRAGKYYYKVNRRKIKWNAFPNQKGNRRDNFFEDYYLAKDLAYITALKHKVRSTREQRMSLIWV